MYNGSESVSVEFEILPDRVVVLDRSSSGITRRQTGVLPVELSVLVPYVITVQLLNNGTSLENVSQAIQGVFNVSGEIVGFNSVGMISMVF